MKNILFVKINILVQTKRNMSLKNNTDQIRGHNKNTYFCVKMYISFSPKK